MTGALTAAIAAAFSGSAVVTDPQFEYTTLLLPGNGTDLKNNNEFLDSSSNAFTVTRNPLTGPNAPTQGTFSPFSQTGWGNYFSGSSQYLSVANNTALNLSSGDFTIEAFVYYNGTNNSSTIISKDGVSGSTYSSYQLKLNGSSYLTFDVGNGSGTSYYQQVTSGTALPTNTWTHVAAVKSGTTLSLYQNGVRVASATQTGTIVDGGKPVLVGYETGQISAYYWNGYISNLRVVKGVAVYSGTSTTTANFNVPTSPLTATQSAGTNISAITGTQTSLLTCQSNRFKDNSTNNFTLTVNGNTSVVAFSPFNPTASWSAATYGGSGYFDGSGDYLSVASNSALQFDGQFTIEAWCYPTTLQTYDCLIITSNSATSANGIGIYLKSGGGILVYNFINLSNIFDTSSGVVLNAWNHIAVTRNSSNGIDLWLNGASQGATQTVSGNFASTTPTLIGATTSASQEFNGYISNARIVKGTAVYTAAFTPPTAPLTATQSANTNGNPSAAITGTATSLLLNFTNAGIYDATSKNDFETVGNAQISTTQSKFGGSSMYFGGTGNYLYKPYDQLLNLLNGNFTIECWIYPTVTNTQMYFAGSANSSGSDNWLFGVTSSNKLYFNWVNTTPTGFAATSTASISQNVWTYVAAVKSGGTITLYINGSADGTSSPTGTYRNASFPFAVGRPGDYNGIYFTGYIQDFRMTTYARTITASPTAAFPTL